MNFIGSSGLFSKGNKLDVVILLAVGGRWLASLLYSNDHIIVKKCITKGPIFTSRVGLVQFEDIKMFTFES